LLLQREKISQEVVYSMRCWKHSGFSVNKNVLIEAHDKAGLEELIQYLSRCPFSLERIIKLTDTDYVVYKAEHKNCRRFPDPGDETLKAGVSRKLTLTSFAPDLWSDGLALLGFRFLSRWISLPR
jgi:putative transposase